jgi:hypothetical protein
MLYGVATGDTPPISEDAHYFENPSTARRYTNPILEHVLYELASYLLLI